MDKKTTDDLMLDIYQYKVENPNFDKVQIGERWVVQPVRLNVNQFANPSLQEIKILHKLEKVIKIAKEQTFMGKNEVWIPKEVFNEEFQLVEKVTNPLYTSKLPRSTSLPPY